MIYIQHRVNTSGQLKEVPKSYGVEVDLRDFGDRIIMRHDPFGSGEDFEKFLEGYDNAGPMILNIKSERIELKAVELMRKYEIDNYFFLDCSFPMIHMLNKLGERRIAIRFSEFEPIESALALAGSVEWVWVDCFTKLPLTLDSHAKLRKSFKLCVVSPELHGHPVDRIVEFAEIVAKYPCDAICTKVPDVWKQNLPNE